MLRQILSTIALKKLKSPEQGFGLLEVLVGILIITVFISASTPTLMLGVASRIQTRKIEQAINLSRQELEKIRQVLEQGNYQNSKLPPVANISNSSKISTFNGPGSLCSTSCSANQAFQEGDFLIQTFRTRGVSDDPGGDSTKGTAVAFQMGVRVYANAALSKLKTNQLKTTIPHLGLNNGTKNFQEYPLAVLYVELSRGDTENSLQLYKKLLSQNSQNK